MTDRARYHNGSSKAMMTELATTTIDRAGRRPRSIEQGDDHDRLSKATTTIGPARRRSIVVVVALRDRSIVDRRCLARSIVAAQPPRDVAQAQPPGTRRTPLDSYGSRAFFYTPHNIRGILTHTPHIRGVNNFSLPDTIRAFSPGFLPASRRSAGCVREGHNPSRAMISRTATHLRGGA